MRFGLNFGEIVEATPLMKLKMAGLHSVDFVRLVWYSLEMLVTGQVGLSDMSGPVGIVTTISDVGQGSTSLFMAAANIGYLTALIAINLAVMNLLPIPALDGGQIFYHVCNDFGDESDETAGQPEICGVSQLCRICGFDAVYAGCHSQRYL